MADTNNNGLLWLIVIFLLFKGCSMDKKIEEVEGESDYDSEIQSLQSKVRQQGYDLDSLDSRLDKVESDIKYLH